MLQIKNLHKAFGLNTLFSGVSMQMNPGERLGLVGRNGHGKTTLFKILLGELEHDAGEIFYPKNYRVGHLAQHLKFTEPTIIQEGCLGLMPEEADDHYKVEAILFGLGFTAEDMGRAPSEFSGGFQIRLNLAKVLVSKPNLLLLDEPTNYLDIVSIRWLVQYLRAWKNEIIIISHDRDFMDAVTTHTACIHRCELRKIKGPTFKLYDQIAVEEEVHEKTRLNDDKKRAQMDVFINRFRAKANKASVVQSRIKMRDKMANLEKLGNIDTLDFMFRHTPFLPKTIIDIQDLSFGYPGCDELFSDLTLSIGKQERIGIIGKNGKGKSTLLNLLAGELPPTSGSVKLHDAATLGYFGQTNISRLDSDATIEDEIYRANTSLSRTAVRKLCGTMMFSGDNAEKEIKVLSGGEKSRVLLGKILATPSNMLFLDEPTNHLDMESIVSLTEAMEIYPGAIVLVTHSEEILRSVATKLIIFHRGGVEVFNGNYDDFLEKIGWEEELSSKKSKNSDEKSGRILKNVNKKERDKITRKLKKDIDNTEKRIMKLEKEMQAHSDGIEQASIDQDMDKLTDLSQAIVDTQALIDKEFETLTNHTELLESTAPKES